MLVCSHEFTTHDEAQIALQGWEHTYDHERFSMALAGKTPAEKLALVHRHPSAAENGAGAPPSRDQGGGALADTSARG